VALCPGSQLPIRESALPGTTSTLSLFLSLAQTRSLLTALFSRVRVVALRLSVVGGERDLCGLERLPVGREAQGHPPARPQRSRHRWWQQRCPARPTLLSHPLRRSFFPRRALFLLVIVVKGCFLKSNNYVILFTYKYLHTYLHTYEHVMSSVEVC
jgi:hypothetical protein